MLDVTRELHNEARETMGRIPTEDADTCLRRLTKLLLSSDEAQKSKSVTAIFGLIYNHANGRRLDSGAVAEATTALLHEYTETLISENDAHKPEAVTGFFNLLRCHENGLRLNSNALVDAAIAIHQYLPEGSQKGYLALAVIPKHTDNLPAEKAVAAAGYAANHADYFGWYWRIRLVSYRPTQAQDEFHKDLERMTKVDLIKQQERWAVLSAPIPQDLVTPSRHVSPYRLWAKEFINA